MANDSGEFVDILSDAEENKAEFKLDFDCSERDGLYDEDALYAVYNTNEILALSSLIADCKGFL